ncbi:MAG: hypothetical protein SWH61_12425 [Thermodesulfobacteriota bacterium]|nr:hypothetical protein [Thermodesulfobacteriota bacterium]
MIREKKLNDTFGCGFNKGKKASDMKYCIERGLDYTLYRLGAYRIKKVIWREYGVEISIKDKRLDEVVREAMVIEGG